MSDAVNATPVAWLALLVLPRRDDRRRPARRQRQAHMDVRTAGVWSAIWIAVSILFGAGLWAVAGGDAGETYFAGYVMEKALSLDNVFVFTLIFGALAVPRDEQPRVLLYGILVALVLRARVHLRGGRGARGVLVGRVPVRGAAGLDGLADPALRRGARRGREVRRPRPAAVARA